MKQCPKCGKMLNDSMAFCTQCGTPLANAAAQPAPQPPQQPVWSVASLHNPRPGSPSNPPSSTTTHRPTRVLNTSGWQPRRCFWRRRLQSGMVLFNIIASMAGTSGLLGTVGTYLSMILSLGGYSSRSIRPAGRHRLAVHRGVPGRDLGGAVPGYPDRRGPLAHLPCGGWQDQHSDEKHRLYPRQDQHASWLR